MSDNFKYTAGLNNVGSYQVSGKPFVTASTISDGAEQQIEFPQVTNNITVRLDNPNNSVAVEGASVYYQNSNPINANDGDNRTITAWISASNNTSVDPSNGIIIAGSTINNHFVFKEKNNNPFQAQLSNSSGITSLVNIDPGTGWYHIALVASSSAYFRVLINGQERVSKVIGPTSGAALGGGLVLGPPSQGETHIKFRDAMLWDDALSNTEVLALYQASASYSDPAFAAANKLVWIKPVESPVDSPVNSLLNSGDPTYGNMTLNAYTSGEVAEISSDSPFTNSGSLRVHYRSTGSSNVATNNHYWTLDSQNESITMNVKSKELYLSADGGDCDYSIHADLTSIPSSRMYQHTGSGVDE